MNHKTPASMPTLAHLRRAVSPQPKDEIFNPSDKASTPPQEEGTVVPEAKIPLLKYASRKFSNVEGEKTEMFSDIRLKPVPTTKPSLPAKYESPVPVKDSSLVTERPPFISWKSIDPSPSPSPSNKDEGGASATNSIMPASDAGDTIGGVVSLKERMAIFQGNGGSGPANLPPKPAPKKPMWKPPPKPITSPLLEEKLPIENRATVRSPPVDTKLTQAQAKKPAEFREQRGEGSEAKVRKVPDEEEHQQRTDTTVRIQPLDGAKIRNAPPVIAPKPSIRRPSTTEEENRPGMHCTQWLDGALLTTDNTEATPSPPIARDVPKERREPRPEGMS